MALSFAQFGNDLYSGRRSYNFVGHWRRWLGIGLITVVACTLILVFKGLNPGIEFRGGSEFLISGVTTTDQGIATDIVTAAVPDAEPPRVSLIGDNSMRVQTERLSDEQTSALRDQLATGYDVEPSAVTSSYVGASWGKDVTNKALTGLGIFLVLVSIVIAAYFRGWQMAAAAVIALIHDLVATAGIYALTGFEVTPASVIGFLTILGYSLYDTVVVFDKIRENTAHVFSSTRRTYADAVNLAVNQTLVRSINTSIVALLPVAAILFIGAFLMGAGTLKDISLALLIGIIAGTYSSVFLAPPLLVLLRSRDKAVIAQAAAVAKARSRTGDTRGDTSVGPTVTATLTKTATATTVGATATTTTGTTGSTTAGTASAAQHRSEAGRGPRNQPKRAPKRNRGRR